jgi:hypothetical protein
MTQAVKYGFTTRQDGLADDDGYKSEADAIAAAEDYFDYKAGSVFWVYSYIIPEVQDELIELTRNKYFVASEQSGDDDYDTHMRWETRQGNFI